MCGSRLGKHPAFAAAMRELGILFGQNGIELIYGAGSIGCMGVLSTAVRTSGSKAIGVTVSEIAAYEDPPAEDETHAVYQASSMGCRKAEMMAGADAAILGPGGAGSLDEMWEWITFDYLNLHKRDVPPLVILNVNGLYDGTIMQIRDAQAAGFMYDKMRYEVATSPEEAINLITRYWDAMPKPHNNVHQLRAVS